LGPELDRMSSILVSGVVEILMLTAAVAAAAVAVVAVEIVLLRT